MKDVKEMLSAFRRRCPLAKVALFAACLGLLAWVPSLQAQGPELDGAAAEIQGHADATVISVNQEGPERIVIDYDIDRFRQTPVNIDGGEYTQLKLGKESVMKEVVGAPELPQICRSFIIPNDAQMAVNVLASKYYDIPDMSVTPSKGHISRQQNPADVPYTFGDAYKTDAFYPGEVASLGKPYILRDFRGVVLTLTPFQYNPVTETLRVYTNVTVEIVKTRAGKVNLKTSPFRPDDVSLAFHKVYKNHFLNYGADSRYTPLGETGDMLIIYHDAWLSNIQPLVDHKNNAMGISTTAVGVSTIGNDSTSIKNYIQNEYDTGDLAFVLLVGDADEVATPTASGGSSDPSYSKLAGGDNYPDIMVGRFSAQDSGDVDTQVERTIEYETTPATQQAWFKKGTGIASDQGPGHNGEYDHEHMRYIRTDLLGYGYTEVDELYDGSQGGQDASGNPTPSMVAACLNAGRGIINYCGHGSITSWSTSGFDNGDINALTNDNMLPFIVSVACVNGQFDGYTCFGETWLRATNGSEPTGAIGCYASSINQDWDPPMTAQDESVDLLVSESYFSFGALCFAGSCKMMDLHGTSGLNMFNTWHVFGDPSVRVYGSAGPPTCDDGILNQGEDRIDCGGPCPPCECTADGQCDNGLFCDGAETCDAYGDCQSGSDPCAGHLGCNEVDDVCIECYNDGDCDDGLFCTGVETCVDEACVAGTDPCPGQTCDEVNDQCVEGPAVVYEWDMSTDPSWTAGGQWAWGQPTGGGGQYGEPDPTNGYTGNNVYGYNLSGDYANDLPETHLTTTVIDCTGLSDVTLKFWRWLGVEQPTYDHAYIRVSNNGSSWTQVWTNSVEVTDSSWSQQEFDLSTVADDESTVYIRWTMGTTDGSWQYCGWNIDDVEIWAVGGAEPTCDDGILNQGEDRIDCGGPCPPCECTADGQCDNGAFCDGEETCDDYGDCQSGSDPCAGYLGCNEVDDVCIECYNNGDCDDGLFCNGAETCVDEACVAGSDPCPGQSCDEVNDQCVPLPEKYTPAEYDDNEGMLTVWGSYDSVVTDMAVAVTNNDPDAIVYVVVQNSSEQSSATSTLTSAGADMNQVDFIIYDTDTTWIRDYGPRFVMDNGERAIIDFDYNRPRPDDNAFPAFLGSLWGETVSEMPLTHGGGNLQIAGDDAFMSELILDENLGLSEQDVADIIDQYHNLDLTIYGRFPSSFDYTGHIDMWMLPVSDGEVIVGEYSSSTGDPYTITEAAASDLTSKGYTVYRTPGWQSGGTHYTYTNGVIMNDVVLVPQYYTSEDATALAVFQAAFPDRTTIQIDCTSIISAAGAIHCIMAHVPVDTPAATCSDGIQNQGEDKIDCGGPCPACNCLVDGDCLFCNGETCDAYGECQPGDYPCEPEEWCDEENDVCVSLPPCAVEDVNCDGTTDSLDLGVVKNPANWLLAVASAAEPRTDVNGDGLVDSLDLGAIKNPTYWLSSTGDCQCPE